MDNSRIVLTNAVLVDVAGGTTQDKTTVVIQNERIESVLHSAPTVFDDCIEADGLFLCPGLIDAHAHFFLDGGASPRSTFLETDDETKMTLAAKNARLAIETGITTMRDCGAPAPLMFQLQQHEKQGKLPAPHIVSSGFPLMRPKGHCHFFGKEVTTKAEVRQIIEYQLSQGATFVKLMASGGGLTPGTNPAEADLPLELMREAADVAHANGAQITAHCHATQSIQNALDAGLDMIEHVSFVEPPGRYRYDENLALKLRDKGVIVSPTVIGALRTAERFRNSGQVHNPHDLGAIDRLEGRLTNTGHFHRLGMKIVAGSDCGATDTPFDSLVDEIIAYTRAGMSKAEALRAATFDNAAFMNLSKVGEIRAGYHADVILLQRNPLEDLNVFRNPTMVIKSGQVIHKVPRA